MMGAQADEQQGRRRLARPWSATDRPVARVLVQPLQRFLHTEVAGGVLLLAAAVIALVWANSPLSDSYARLWETQLTLRLGGLELSEDLRHWVNDLLMALFFVVVGLEIKRELVHGELRDVRAALLPLLCAIGGMVVPALLYLAVNAGGPGTRGWGIPMATDIAFALGILAVVGARAPTGLKVFLLTLAIVDDIGAILVIAAFYSQGVSAAWLGAAAGFIVLIVVLRRLQVRALLPYVLLAGLLWLAVFESGVHAAIAGVVLGLLTPARPFHPPERVTGVIDAHLRSLRAQRLDGIGDESEQSCLLDVSRLAGEAVSPLARLERGLHPWSAFVVLPLFALANAGIVLSADTMRSAFGEPVVLGVVIGLVLGKPLGIAGMAAAAVALGWASLPRESGWRQLLGVSVLAGVGFTLSIFMTGLAFASAELVGAAKVGILAASVLAGLSGGLVLTAGRARRPGP